MSKQRKDEHIKYAKSQVITENDFSKIRLIHHSIPSVNFSDINLETTYLGHTFSYPFYINAMTGGNKKGNALNYKLAKLASLYNIPFFVGSQSLAFKEKGVKEQYIALRKAFPHLFIVANINPNFTLAMAKEAVNMLNANALAIHVNSIQELVMIEGDRDFSKWLTNIKTIVEGVNVPVIVKEVGYGMHLVTIEKLISIGVKNIDLSGTGGTNFTKIETDRKKENDSPFIDFGLSAVESLLIAPPTEGVTYFASGGIHSGVNIVKALALGAKAVGMARYFLDLSDLEMAEAQEKLDELILDIKKTLVLLNAKEVTEVNISHVFKSPLV